MRRLARVLPELSMARSIPARRNPAPSPIIYEQRLFFVRRALDARTRALRSKKIKRTAKVSRQAKAI